MTIQEVGIILTGETDADSVRGEVESTLDFYAATVGSNPSLNRFFKNLFLPHSCLSAPVYEHGRRYVFSPEVDTTPHTHIKAGNGMVFREVSSPGCVSRSHPSGVGVPRCLQSFMSPAFGGNREHIKEIITNF